MSPGSRIISAPIATAVLFRVITAPEARVTPEARIQFPAARVPTVTANSLSALSLSPKETSASAGAASIVIARLFTVERSTLSPKVTLLPERTSTPVKP